MDAGGQGRRHVSLNDALFDYVQKSWSRPEEAHSESR